VTADTLNSHYATISTDAAYVAPCYKSSASRAYEEVFTEFKVFQILDHLKTTATGPDGLPSWFLRLSAPVLARPLAVLLNLSLSFSFVPVQWKSSCINPIPKVPHPSILTDYRPISITSVLSRLTERVIVSTYVYPNFSASNSPLNFSDQFAFRPSGLTTSALIYLLNTISNILVIQPFVRVIALDFSKAFDSVRQSELMDKYAMLDLPDFIHNWLVNFFTGRQHNTRFNRAVSLSARISSSVIQGSAIGPASYAVTASDLRPITPGNDLMKFADDTYLIVPANLISTTDIELQHIDQWSSTNNLKLNRAKTFEIIFHSRYTRTSTLNLPLPIVGVSRVTDLKCLGVTLSCNFSVTKHISETINSCSQSLYALRNLRAHGLCDELLQLVFKASTLSKLLYASPAWWGFTSASDKQRLEAYLRKATRSNFYATTGSTFSALCDTADSTLFKSIITNPYHVLHRSLPPKISNSYNLRARPHQFTLPLKHNVLDEQNFLPRMLYNSCH
jgi:hypothetical protein